MVVGKSPEWLPPGFTAKVKYKNGRKIKYYFNDATGTKYLSKKDVIRATEDNGELVTPQKENGHDGGLSSYNKVGAISVKTNDSPSWLPNGWIVEERTRQSGSSKGSVYKVYTDLSSGSKFYSKAAVTRYLNTLDQANIMTVQNKIDDVDEPKVYEPSIDMSPLPVSMTNIGGINNVDKPNMDEPTIGVSPQLASMANTGGIINVDKPNVDETSIDMSLQLVSMTNTGGINKKKRKNNSFVTVATEHTTDDDLPPGWIKEIKTSKSGDRIRKDPYYTDPVSGYVFRSKLDALRYLKTNDIGSCACRPLKRELDDIKLIENEIPSSNTANEKLSVNKRQRLLLGELNNGGESSVTKDLAESEASISKQKRGNSESDIVKVEENISCENSKKNAEIINNPEPENDVYKEDGKVTVLDVAISKQQLSESENRTKVNSRKSRKRRDLSLPSRSSKRLAGSQPEIDSNPDLNERSLRAAARKSSGSEVDKSPMDSATIPIPSDIEQPKEAAEQAFIGEESHQDRLKEVEDLFNDIEEPPTEGLAIPEEQSGGEKQIDESKRSEESQLCYDFGDSWSDPLEFAFKTLMGEISIDDPLAFSSCFNEQNGTPHNQADGCLKQSQSDAPQNEFASHSESSKQHSAVDQLPTNSSSFSTLGNVGFTSFGGFNCQSSTEVGKKDSQTKFNP